MRIAEVADSRDATTSKPRRPDRSGGRRARVGFAAVKALVKSRAEPGIWLEDVPEPEIGINDVLIRVGATGICGTDVHIHRWDAWAQRTIPVPLVIGHEFV